MAAGKVTRVFPGGNTSLGFFSYYNHIIGEDANRIFVIKGGPGVGKSTMMKKTGQALLDLGYDIEHHYCSSDNDSLDALCIPAIGIAMLDGTFPHVVDPVNPGAVSEIIHLGDFWDESHIIKHKKDIISTNKRLSRFFATAYSQLTEAKVIRDEMAGYVIECMDFSGISKLAMDLGQEMTSHLQSGRRVNNPRVRRLFRSAISPNGVVHYQETLLSGINNLYLIKGRPGSGRSTLLADLVRTACARGLNVEAFHCAFDPYKLDLLIIKEISTAVLKHVDEVVFDPYSLTGTKVTCYNLDVFLNHRMLAVYEKELAEAAERFSASLNRAIRYLGKAKQTHDMLEEYYIPAMDFAAVEQKRNEIFQRILAYAARTAQQG